MSSKTVVSLDFGSAKTAAVAAQLEHGRVKVVGLSTVESRGVRKGAIVDVGEAAKAADDALREVEQQIEADAREVVVGIGGRHVECVQSRGFVPIVPATRAITHDDVLQVINHSRTIKLPEDREQILALPTEFQVDGKAGLSSPVGCRGGRLEVRTYLATAESMKIEELERAIQAGGRAAAQILPIGLACGLGVLTHEHLQRGAAIVDIGAETTNLAVYRHGSILCSSWLPIGGAHVTSDLAKLLKTSPEEAERLKRKHGLALASMAGEGETIDVMQLGQIERRPMAKKVFCEIVECRLREIAHFCKHEFGRLGRLSDAKTGLVLSGGTANMPGLEELFGSVFAEVAVLSGCPHPRGPLAAEAQRPELGAAIGLARFALECGGEELCAAGENGKWRDKMRTFVSLLGGKA